MDSRVSGTLLTAWFFFAIASLLAAALSPSGFGLLLPGLHPVTWFYPAGLLLPPLVLLSQRALGPDVSRPIALILTTILGLFALVVIAGLASYVLGI
ncbi:MAG: hypothetical protein V2I74_09965 [Erythrobacter sp.]|jgi:hypothetical protein|nr:hypothetical protein [Erythrobacter sp.]